MGKSWRRVKSCEENKELSERVTVFFATDSTDKTDFTDGEKLAAGRILRGKQGAERACDGFFCHGFHG
jgi:hypothetical protein